nr:RecName: Full=Ovotransferrin; Short=OVT [Dromaius novaehollandiae]
AAPKATVRWCTISS